MLFDLRGRGRRRTVRAIYIGLALLMGVGLVGFGVGGGLGGGGLFNSVGNGEGAGNTTYGNQIKKYRKLTAQQAGNAAAWEELTKAIVHESSNFTQNGVTPRGKELFKEAAQAW